MRARCRARVIDTHAHLDSCGDDAGELLARARAAGVSSVITIGSGIASCRESLAIADIYDGVHCALGIHPHLAGEVAEGDFDVLRELLEHPSVVAVGETGLDFYRNRAAASDQQAAFAAQIELARETGKALVIHAREADEETLDTLARHADGLTVILHCLSSERLARASAERGYYASFAGNVTYPKADELRAAAQIVPDDLLLAETDTPYLSPQAVRSKPNEPSYVPHVYEALAAARGQPLEDCVRTIAANARRAFSL